jgi:hypothetical protein
MAIAHHLKIKNGADTRFMVCGILAFDPRLEWPNFMAFLELKRHPNFFTSPSLDVKKDSININDPMLLKTIPTYIIDLLNNDSNVSDVSINNNNNVVDATISLEVLSVKNKVGRLVKKKLNKF